MKRLIYNFVLREPRRIEPYFISGKYETLTFYVDSEEQTIFVDLLSDIEVGDVSKTELYISGVRYNPNEDYNIIDDGTLVWLDNLKLSEGQRCVFVYR